jgi:hypothetical protein
VQRPPQDAIGRLDIAVRHSKRKTGIRVPGVFVRDSEGEPAAPPLAGLLQGGGEIRIKVLLTVLMMATRPPHETKVSAKDLAAMLNLPRPDKAGARRVSKALGDLERAGLVRRELRPGYVPSTTVLNPAGDRQEWDDTELEPGYVSLPVDLWRRGWIIALSGRAIAFLLILQENTNGRPHHEAWIPGHRKLQYGLSDDTWTKATKELRQAGLLDIREEIHAYYSEPRRRNVYTLHLDRVRHFDPGQVPADPLP